MVFEDWLYMVDCNIGDYIFYEVNFVLMGILYWMLEEMWNIKLIKLMYVDEFEVLDVVIK